MVDDHVTVVAGVDTAAAGRDSAPAGPEAEDSRGSAPVPGGGVERPWNGARTAETDRGVWGKGKGGGGDRVLARLACTGQRALGLEHACEGLRCDSGNSPELEEAVTEDEVADWTLPGPSPLPALLSAAEISRLISSLMLSAPRPPSVVVTGAPLLVRCALACGYGGSR